jgi:hypothetical protein
VFSVGATAGRELYSKNPSPNKKERRSQYHGAPRPGETDGSEKSKHDQCTATSDQPANLEKRSAVGPIHGSFCASFLLLSWWKTDSRRELFPPSLEKHFLGPGE